MEDRIISWNSDLEQLIAQEAEKSFGLSWLHNQSELYNSFYDTFISIPVIILSTVAGFLSASSGSLLPQNTTTSVFLGSISISVGILNTIGSKFGFSKLSEGHRIASIHYSKLHRFLNIELSLPRKERKDANNMLKLIREDIDRLKETAPPIHQVIVKKFNDKFKNEPNIAKPDITNGLSKIDIYNEFIPSPKPESNVKVSIV